MLSTTVTFEKILMILKSDFYVHSHFLISFTWITTRWNYLLILVALHICRAVVVTSHSFELIHPDISLYLEARPNANSYSNGSILSL